MSNSVEVKIQKLVRDLGRLILSDVERKQSVPASERTTGADPTSWISTFLDARWYADAEGWTAICRIVLPNGGRRSLRTSDAVDGIIMSLSELRKQISTNLWYGLKLSVTPDGNATVEFNDDPNCVIEPMWWRS